MNIQGITTQKSDLNCIKPIKKDFNTQNMVNSFEFSKGYNVSNFNVAFGARQSFPSVKDTNSVQKKSDYVNEKADEYFEKSKNISEKSKMEFQNLLKIQERALEIMNTTPVPSSGIKASLINYMGQPLKFLVSDKDKMELYVYPNSNKIMQIKVAGKPYSTLVKYSLNGTLDFSVKQKSSKISENSKEAYHFTTDGELLDYWENRTLNYVKNSIDYPICYHFKDGKVNTVSESVKSNRDDDVEYNKTASLYKFVNDKLDEYLENVKGSFVIADGKMLEHEADGCMLFSNESVPKIYENYSQSALATEFTSEMESPKGINPKNDEMISNINSIAEKEKKNAKRHFEQSREYFNDVVPLKEKVAELYSKTNSLNGGNNPNLRIKYHDGKTYFYMLDGSGKTKMKALMDEKTGLPIEIDDISNETIYTLNNDGNLTCVIVGHNRKYNEINAPTDADLIFKFSDNGFLQSVTKQKETSNVGIINTKAIYNFSKSGKLSACQLYTILKRKSRTANSDYVMKFDKDENLSKVYVDRLKSEQTIGNPVEQCKKLISFSPKNVVTVYDDIILGEEGIESAECYASFQNDKKDFKLISEIME